MLCKPNILSLFLNSFNKSNNVRSSINIIHIFLIVRLLLCLYKSFTEEEEVMFKKKNGHEKLLEIIEAIEAEEKDQVVKRISVEIKIPERDISKNTLKPALSGHSKIDKLKVLKPCGSSRQVKSISEFSLLEHSAILLTCIKR